MTSSSLIKVAVVGGGVIGVSTAQQLAQAGADVILLTESVLTSGASGRSLSWLNSAGMWREPYHRLRMAAIDRSALRRLDIRTSAGCASRADWRGTPQTRVRSCASVMIMKVAHGYDSHLIGRDQRSML